MSFSTCQLCSITPIKKALAATLIIGAIGFPLSPSQAQITGAQARLALESALSLLRKSSDSSKRTSLLFKSKWVESPAQREARVTHISLCPRRVLMYVGEEHRLSPLPLNNAKEPVHGIAFSYESGDTHIADVASDGSVTALTSGQCFVTASAGQMRAKVRVEVREGPRPLLTNAEWDAEHANDCTDPERDPVLTSSHSEIQSKRGDGSKPSFSPEVLPAPDGDPPPNVGEAPSRKNAVGHPRFSPNLAMKASATGTDNQLGSSSFNLTVPIFGSGGRGVGVDLNLVYNSRVWTKDVPTNSMVFDYDVGWPAPGFRLNYGRIVRDYNVASGPGDYLLIEADGTRTPLLSQGSNSYLSNDGRNIQFTATTINRLSYSDGTIVAYDQVGAATLLPTYIRDVHGNSITISYVASCADSPRIGTCDCNNGCTKPPKQAIKQITDTLGRIATFYYNSTGQLAEIHVPGYNGGSDRIVAKFAYQSPSLTLAYNFGSMVVAGVPTGNQVDVLRRVYFPDAGRGYIFDSYSSYGMFTHASMRLGMTDASDGTEVAYTEYTFGTAGALSSGIHLNSFLQ